MVMILINVLFFLVWRWVCLVRNRECVDNISRQLAKEPQNHSALSHQYIRGQQWPQPPALCESLHCFVRRLQETGAIDCSRVSLCPQVKRVVVYLGRDKTMQLLEELMWELQLTEPVSSAVTHMDNPPYYRITSSYKIPSVTSGERPIGTHRSPLRLSVTLEMH